MVSAWASVDEMLDAERFCITLICETDSVNLSDIKINVYSAQLEYSDAESGYEEYVETLAFSVLTDETGSVSFYRPSDSFSITICVDTLPENYGIVDKHTCFFNATETAYSGRLSEISEVSVTRENDQLFPALFDANGNVLLADAKIVLPEQDSIDRTSLTIDEDERLILYNENVRIEVCGEEFIVIDRVEYKYETLIDRETFLLNKGFITEEEYKKKITFYLASDSLDAHTAEEALFIQHIVQGDGVSMMSELETAESSSLASITYATSDNGYFRVYYDTNDSYDGIPMTREIAKNVANAFEAIDTFFCTTMGFYRPYSSRTDNYYKVVITSDIDNPGETRSEVSESDRSAYTVIHCLLALTYDALEGILAHEYMHAIMIRYGIKGDSADIKWMHECFATWAGLEYDDDSYPTYISEYVNMFLDTLGYSLDFVTVEESLKGREYGSVLFAKYIEQTMGGYSTIKYIIESCDGTDDPLEDIDNSLQDLGYSLADAFAGCATFNYNVNYFYSEAPDDEEEWVFPEEKYTKQAPYTVTNWGISPLASHYHVFVPIQNTSATLTITIDYTSLPDAQNARLKGVRVDTNGGHHAFSSSISSNRSTISYSGFGGTNAQKYVLIPVNGSATSSMQYNLTATVKYTPKNGAIYSFKNVATGKYMNVHYGLDQNNVNVYQWTKDGSVEQNFKLTQNENGHYLIRAMCSSNGSNRVLDIVKSSGQVVAGCNVQIYTAVDPTAQEWKLYHVGNGRYKIVPNANTNVALTVYGTSNGSASGTTSTSAGNIYLSTYSGASNQLWELVPVT